MLPRLSARSRLLGHVHELHHDIFDLYERCERLAPIVELRILHRPLYVITQPALIEQVLVHQASRFHKPLFLKGLDWLFGRGLLTSDGPGYRHRRKLAQPAFHPGMHGPYSEELRTRVARLKRSLKPGTHDIYELVVGVCVEQLTSFFFGTESLALSLAIRDVAALCHEVERAAMRAPWTFLLPGVHRRRHVHRVRELERCLERLAEPDGRDQRGHRTLYDRLTTANDVDGCPMRPRAIRDEAITLVLAGHETAAVAVSWVIYLLARTPAVLARLQAELDSVCPEGVPTLEQLAALPYLDAVLRETYRLYPPTHRIGRTTAVAVELGEHRLPQKAEVHLPQWAVHRSPRWFSEPLEFRPERWLGASRPDLPRYAYFPFSGGQRSCPGRDMARIEDALLVSAIVSSFDPSADTRQPARPKSGLTLSPCPVPITLLPRKARDLALAE